MIYNGVPCIEFKGPTYWDGYGVVSEIRVGKKITRAHILAWIDFHGELPPLDKPNILHHCDNPPCMEVIHLFAGTQGDNVLDCIAKGRALVGEDHPSAKLSNEQVKEIRELYATTGISQRSLAKLYGVGKSLVGSIIRNEQRRFG